MSIFKRRPLKEEVKNALKNAQHARNMREDICSPEELHKLDEAVQHLEPGAAGLPEDPLAQFHLGMTYAALDRPDEAIEALNRAIALSPNDERPQFEEARKKIEELENAK